MISDDELLEILNEWNYWKKDIEESVLRLDYVDRIISYFKTKEVVVLKGIRRSGKSTLICQSINELRKRERYSREQFLIINFEDPRFFNYLDLELLDKIFSVYRTFINPEKKCFIFLDEVQNLPLWEKWVRTQRDLRPDKVKILVTGSSGTLLNGEYATALTGRTLGINVFPLSFKEYLLFHDIEIKDLLELVSAKRKLRQLFKSYIRDGGFPETVRNPQKEKLLQEYYESILYRDIIERHKIRDVAVLKKISGYLISNISKEYSYNSIRKVFGTSLDLVREYISHITSSYLMFTLNIFSPSLKVQAVNPDKAYCIDTGLANCVAFRISKDTGRLYENIVFMELTRREKELYYWKDRRGRETDFLIKEGERVVTAIQVSYQIEDEKTRRREVEGLLECLRHFDLNDGIIITENIEKTDEAGGQKIRYIPLWKWLLRGTVAFSGDG